MPAPVESATENGFENKMVGGRCRADAHADIDFPQGRYVEIGNQEDLLLLIVDGRDVADRAVVGIPLDTAADDAGEVVTDFCARRKTETLIHVGAMQGALEGRIDGEVPAPDGLIDDRPDFPGPGVGRVGGTLKADLGGQADSHGPPPGIRYSNPGTDVITHPLHAVSILLAGEDVETDLRPVIEPLGELNRLVLLMVGRRSEEHTSE